MAPLLKTHVEEHEKQIGEGRTSAPQTVHNTSKG